MTAVRIPRYLLRQLRDFAGLADGTTYLVPRWLILRSLGIVYAIAFAGIFVEGRAIVGERGIAPIEEFRTALGRIFPNPAERFLRAPSLFLLDASPQMITAVEWAGLLAAVALVLNILPRVSVLCCWAAFVSFTSTWQLFTSSIVDQLILEAAFLCIFYAPRGLRPGLGADDPPRPIAIFALRWFLLRAMFESGLIKLMAGDLHWRNLTAMQILYETGPSPTILGYLDHQMPQAYHVFEIMLTFTAELVAPMLMVFAGRRGRWLALAAWTTFQAGIQLTINFGWLNTASIALGLVILDDQMLASAASRLGLRQWAGRMTAAVAGSAARAVARWRLYGLRTLIAAYCVVTVYFFWTASRGTSELGIPKARTEPLEFLFRDFRSANVYIPFARFPPAKDEVEFIGSNDGGATWRTYDFRHKPQKEDRICPFTAPWFARFEAALQLGVYVHTPVIPSVARQLLLGNPDVIGLFKSNPFPDRPPTIIRMPVYRFTFTNYATYRKTGRFWHKAYEGDFAKALRLDPQGVVR
jgi:hypothetical protein